MRAKKQHPPTHHNNSVNEGSNNQNRSQHNHQTNASQIYNNYLQKLPTKQNQVHTNAQSGITNNNNGIGNSQQQQISHKQNQDSSLHQNGSANNNPHSQQYQNNDQQNAQRIINIQNHNGNAHQNSMIGQGVYPNAYISHSPQPHTNNLKSKKQNLMVYGFNGAGSFVQQPSGNTQKNGNLALQIGINSITNSNGNLDHSSGNGYAAIGSNNKVNHGVGTALNIKSQKSINGQFSHNINQNHSNLKDKDQILSIKKEKERISSLLNQNQGTKMIVPSSRNSKEDQQQSQTQNIAQNFQSSLKSNNINGGHQHITHQQQQHQQLQQSQQQILPQSNGNSPVKYTSSFQVQPSNIHELNSFLNSSHYYNAVDNFQEKKKQGVNQALTNLMQRKNNPGNLEKSSEYLGNSPLQHGLSSASKAKDIRFQHNEDMKTIETELRAANEVGYVGLLTDPLDKHSKSVLSKNGNNPLQVIPASKQNNVKSINKILEQKRSFDFTSKRPNAAGGGSRQGSGQDTTLDINQEVSEILNQVTQVNNSFTDKKTVSSKWVLMNSKHVRNKSEVKIVGSKNTGGATNQLNQILTKDQHIRNGLYGDDIKPSQPIFSEQNNIPSIVTKYACKTRQGFIPNTKKTNQDAYIIQKEFAGIKGCWFLGVFDGHGQNGHLVSDFCKRTIPMTLSNIINGGNGVDPIPGLVSANNKKRKNKGSRHFLPPLVGQVNKKENSGPYSFVGNNHTGIYDELNLNKNADQLKTSNSINDRGGDQVDYNQIQNWMSSNQGVRDTQIKEAFRIAQEKLEYGTKIDCMFSGTTAVSVLIHQNTVICANSGDSRAILCSQNQAGIWSFTALNRDHKPEEPDEAARVRKCNGRIEQSRLMPGQPGYGNGSGYQSNQPQFFGPKRVWLKHKQVPGLAMTRSMGDLVAKSVGVTYEPELKSISNLTSQDKFIVIGSDGLWDRIPNDEVCRIVAHPFYERGDPEGAVQYLVKESAERWTREQGMIDDITIIIAFINPSNGTVQTASHAQVNNTYQNAIQNSNNRSESRAGQQSQ